MAEWKRRGLTWRTVVAPVAAVAALAAAATPSIAAPGDGQEGSSPVVGQDAAGPGRDDLVQVVVRTNGSSGENAVDAATAEVLDAGGVTGAEVPLVGGVAAEMTLAEARALDAQPGVVVVPNEIVTAAGSRQRGVRRAASAWRDAARAARRGDRTDGRTDRRRPDKGAVKTAYPFTVGATGVWDTNFRTGESTAVAVVDSGVADLPDLAGRLTHVAVNPAFGTGDGYGHGTHVAGIIAGRSADDAYVGVAPSARIVDVKVMDAEGRGDLVTVLAGLQWVSENAASQGIRVVNMSLGSATPLGYMEHPLNAAVQALWRQGIVVVVAAGNGGEGTDAISRPPANDPFVITVGASDDRGTPQDTDDVVAPFSSRGRTKDGVAKPDVYAPGVGIVAPLAPGSLYERNYPSAVVDGRMRLSGSSMATAVMSGVTALMLDARPTLTPGRVKAALMKNARTVNGMAVPDAYRAVNDHSDPGSSDEGLNPAPTLRAMWGDLESQASWAKASWARASWAKASWARASWAR